MQVFGRAISRHQKLLLMLFTSVALSLGGSLMSLDQKDWNSWWWAKRIGWSLLLAGNVSNTARAFFSDPRPKTAP